MDSVIAQPNRQVSVHIAPQVVVDKKMVLGFYYHLPPPNLCTRRIFDAEGLASLWLAAGQLAGNKKHPP